MKRSSIRLQYNAPVTLTFFFFVPRLSLVLGYLTNNWTTSHLFSVYRSSMTDPSLLCPICSVHRPSHGGWDHFINNMLLFLVVVHPFGRTIRKPNTSSGILMTALVSGILLCCFPPPPRIAWCIRYRIHAHHALQFGRQ